MPTFDFKGKQLIYAHRIGYVTDRDRDDWEVLINTADVSLRGKAKRFHSANA